MNVYQDTIYPIGNPNERIVSQNVEDIIALAPNRKRSSGRFAEKRKDHSMRGNKQ